MVKTLLREGEEAPHTCYVRYRFYDRAYACAAYRHDIPLYRRADYNIPVLFFILFLR